MPVEFRINKNDGIIYIKAQGDIKAEQLLASQKEVFEHPDFKQEYNTFLDFSSVRPSHTENYNKIKMLASKVESTQEQRGACKWAIYAPSIIMNNYSQVFSQLTAHLQIKTKVFKDKDEAKEWLLDGQ